jgi:hypothetical protein
MLKDRFLNLNRKPDGFITTEAQVPVQGNTCGIFGGQRGTRTVIYRSRPISVFSFIVFPPMLHTHIHFLPHTLYFTFSKLQRR